MREHIETLLQQLHQGRSAIFTMLVETRGSTPRKAGATMILFPDGSQIGTLGGGCVEAEVKRTALQHIDTEAKQLLTFQLDNQYGWDDGLICGGRMTILIDPLTPDSQTDYYETLLQQLRSGWACIEIVMLKEKPNQSLYESDRMLLDLHETIIAVDFQQKSQLLEKLSKKELLDCKLNTVLPELSEALKPLTSRPRPWVARNASFLPYLQRCPLVIVGAGHIGQKVAELASDVDFDVLVIDDREQYCNPDRFPNATRLVVAPIEEAVSRLEVTSETFCIIVTRGHKHDEEALYHLAESPAAYVGMIGSQRKIKLIFEDLIAAGISQKSLQNVHAPLGINIGSQTVPEIAISIVAELIAYRNLEC